MVLIWEESVSHVSVRKFLDYSKLLLEHSSQKPKWRYWSTDLCAQSWLKTMRHPGLHWEAKFTNQHLMYELRRWAQAGDCSFVVNYHRRTWSALDGESDKLNCCQYANLFFGGIEPFQSSYLPDGSSCPRISGNLLGPKDSVPRPLMEKLSDQFFTCRAFANKITNFVAISLPLLYSKPSQ